MHCYFLCIDIIGNKALLSSSSNCAVDDTHFVVAFPTIKELGNKADGQCFVLVVVVFAIISHQKGGRRAATKGDQNVDRLCVVE